MPKTTRFTNLQLELLNLFNLNLPEDDLLKIRDLLLGVLAEKASDYAQESIQQQGIQPDELIGQHNRRKASQV